MNGVWMAMPISDAIATIVAAFLMFGLIRKFKKSPSQVGFKGKVE
jgi:Na+-driven multidrug efflux pump